MSCCSSQREGVMPPNFSGMRVSWSTDSREPLLGKESEPRKHVVLLLHCSKAQGQQNLDSLKLGVIAQVNARFLGRAVKSSAGLG